MDRFNPDARYNAQINNCKNVQANVQTSGITNIFVRGQNVQVGQGNTFYNNQEESDSSDDESLSNEQEDQLNNCHEDIDDDELREIAKNFSHDWHYLGKSLNITEDDLEQVLDPQKPKSLVDMAWEVLKIWKRNHGNSTISDLAKTLEENEADQYKKRLFNTLFKPKGNNAIGGPASRPAIVSPSSEQLVQGK